MLSPDRQSWERSSVFRCRPHDNRGCFSAGIECRVRLEDTTENLRTWRRGSSQILAIVQRSRRLAGILRQMEESCQELQESTLGANETTAECLQFDSSVIDVISKLQLKLHELEHVRHNFLQAHTEAVDMAKIPGIVAHAILVFSCR